MDWRSVFLWVLVLIEWVMIYFARKSEKYYREWFMGAIAIACIVWWNLIRWGMVF